jgi:DNA-binding HxlR family transcriptional regulator
MRSSEPSSGARSPKPMHCAGLAQPTARCAAAFVLDPAGATRTEALGTERVERELREVLPERARARGRRGGSLTSPTDVRHSLAVSRIPKHGRPVRGSRSGEPIMALLDLLGRRWNMRVIWELRGDEPLNFRALQQRCDGMSSSVLNRRLAELRVAGVVEQGDRGYALTLEGRRLLELYPELNAWAERWARRAHRDP